MPTHVISGSRGLITNTASLSTAGGLRIAQDVVIRRPVPVGIDYGQIQSGGGLIEPRRSYEQFSQFTFPTIDAPIVGMFEYDNQTAPLGAVFYLIGQTGKIYRVDLPTLLTPIAPTESLGLVPNTTSWAATQAQTGSATNYVRSAQLNGNVYFTTKYGVYVFDQIANANRPRPAGIPRAPDITKNGTNANNPWLANNASAAYRVLWAYRDPGQSPVLGPPSGRYVVYNTTGGIPASVNFPITVPPSIVQDILKSGGRTYIYQIYRTAQSAAGAGLTTIPDPGDAMTMIFQGSTSSGATFNYTDITQDGFIKGPDLYTNANQEGIQSANYPPPACADLAAFKGVMFYANCTGTTRVQFTLVGAPNAGTVGAMTGGGAGFNLATAPVSGLTAPNLQGLVTTNRFTVGGFSVMGLTATGYPVTMSITGNAGGVNSNGDFFINAVSATTVTIVAQNLTPGTGGSYLLHAVGINGGDLAISAAFGAATDFTNVTPPATGFNDTTGRQVVFNITTTGTPAQNIVLTANRIVSIFQIMLPLTYPSPPMYLSLLSGPTDNPGIIGVEASNPGLLVAGSASPTQTACTILCTFDMGHTQIYPDCSVPFAPTQDISVARLYYSKPFQPEAVPLNSSIDIGDKGAPIRRVVATRDNLFIFKDDGVYRLSDDPNGGAKPVLYDPTLILLNPNLVCTMDNQVFMLSTRGFFQLSNTGAKEFGLNIRDLTTMLIEAQTTSLPNVCIGNERDQMIYFTVPGPNSSVWSLAYSLITHTWTQGGVLGSAAPLTWPGLYYKGTLSSSLKALHSGVILRHSTRDTSNAGSQVAAGDIVQEAVVDKNDNYLAQNLVATSSIAEALNCLPTPGDRYYFRVLSASGSMITMSQLGGTLGVTPTVGDAIYQLGQTTQYWTITKVVGSNVTVAPYISTANATPSITGTTSFNLTPGACQLLKPLNIALEWSGFNAGNDSKLKHWGGAGVLFDELCSATDTFSIYSYTEIDQVAQTTSWPPTGLVVHPVYSARIMLPIRHQRSRRVHLGFTGGQALKFTVISGVVFEAIEHAEGRETE